MKDKIKRPIELLNDYIGRKVVAKLKDDTEYKGKLLEVDNYMNVLLEKATEYMDEVPMSHYVEIYIRGGSLLYVRLV